MGINTDKTVTIHIRVTESTKEKIDLIAAQKGRTVSDYAREVLTNETHNKEVMEALEEQNRLLEENNRVLSRTLKFAISASITLEEFIKIEGTVEKSRLLQTNVAKRMFGIFEGNSKSED